MEGVEMNGNKRLVTFLALIIASVALTLMVMQWLSRCF